MRQRLHEIGAGGTFEDPPPRDPWSNRMQWKPPGTPAKETHTTPPEMTADDLLAAPAVSASPEVERVKPLHPEFEEPAPTKIPIKPSRFDWKPTRGKLQKPDLRFMASADVDQAIAALQAEQAKPAYQQNAARIDRMKTEILKMMQREESQWVQQAADQLLEAGYGVNYSNLSADDKPERQKEIVVKGKHYAVGQIVYSKVKLTPDNALSPNIPHEAEPVYPPGTAFRIVAIPPKVYHTPKEMIRRYPQLYDSNEFFVNLVTAAQTEPDYRHRVRCNFVCITPLSASRRQTQV